MTADLLIPSGHVAAMDLPAVCVRTGEPATSWVRSEFSRPPKWIYATILLGLVPFFVILLAAPRITARLPACRRVAVRKRLVAALVAVAGVTGALLFFISPIASSLPLGIAGVVLIGVATGTYLRFWSRVWVRGRLLEDGNLLLMGVHPAYAEATAAITRRGPLPGGPGIAR